MKFNYSMDNNK